MKILALESSALAASAALCEDEVLLAQSFQNSGLTHSQTLLTMVNDVMDSGGIQLKDVDLIAVANGPGSFTGLRIGVATAKGLAWAAGKPCVGCSTLESMAWNLAGISGTVCAAMDARRNQVYNALFRVGGGRVKRLSPDRAIGLDELVRELSWKVTPQILVGDGAALCYGALQRASIPAYMAPANLRMQAAWGVARLGLELARQGKTISPNELVPNYHRLSQAERERLERERLEREKAAKEAAQKP